MQNHTSAIRSIISMFLLSDIKLFQSRNIQTDLTPFYIYKLYKHLVNNSHILIISVYKTTNTPSISSFNACLTFTTSLQMTFQLYNVHFIYVKIMKYNYSHSSNRTPWESESVSFSAWSSTIFHLVSLHISKCLQQLRWIHCTDRYNHKCTHE